MCQAIFRGEVHKRLSIVSRNAIECCKPHESLRIRVNRAEFVVCQSVFFGEVDKFLPIIPRNPRSCTHPQEFIWGNMGTCALMLQDLELWMISPSSFFETSNAEIGVFHGLSRHDLEHRSVLIINVPIERIAPDLIRSRRKVDELVPPILIGQRCRNNRWGVLSISRWLNNLNHTRHMWRLVIKHQQRTRDASNF